MKRISLTVIRVYQVTLGPLLGVFSSCRYQPTCSRYGHQAIQRFGARRGWWLALRRIARCAPWGSSGDDPVPDQYISWSQVRQAKRELRTTIVEPVVEKP